MKRLSRIIVVLISFIIFTNLFLFRQLTPLSIGFFLLGLNMLIYIIADYRHKAMLLLVAINIFIVVILLTRAARFIQIQGVLSLLTISSILWYVSISESELFGSFTAVFLSPFYALLSYIKRFFSFIKPSTITYGYKRFIFLFGNNNHTKNTSTLIGFIIAFPVALILLTMFSAADPIYYSYLKNIISPDFLEELPWRIVLSFLFMFFIVPLFFPKMRRIFLSPGQVLGRIKMTQELTIVMATLVVIILSFIIIQWQYIFVNVKAETDLSRFGVSTYAEYVTKGFIELLRVSIFIYALLWLGLTTLRQSPAFKNKTLYVLQWIVIAEFSIILLSIARRVYLYQMFHGLTLIRVYGSFFLIWLVCMTLTLAGRHINSKIRFGIIEGVLTLILLIILGVWNVEQYIVLKHPPTVNKRIDYVYLSRMSADGIDGWLQAYSHAKQVIEKNSNQQGEIDKNARQEIAYAEFVLRRITFQYFDYMNKYAAVSEMKTYISSIADYQIKRLETERLELTEYRKTRQDEQWIADRLLENIRTQKGLHEIKKQPLDRVISNKDTTNEFTDISVEHRNNLVSFEPLSSSAPILYSFYSSNSNMYGPYNPRYFSNITTKYAKKAKLDWLYSINTSDLKAFSLLKNRIPLADLHSLHDQYFDLQRRIGKQSSRDYEHDVSLNSPLL